MEYHSLKDSGANAPLLEKNEQIPNYEFKIFLDNDSANHDDVIRFEP